MKRNKTLLILVIVLAVICVGGVLASKINQKVEHINDIDENVFEVDAEQVTGLSWTKDGKTLTFEKEDDTWFVSGNKDFPVDQEKIADLLEQFKEVHASFIIDQVDDASQYGLDNPEGTITFTTEDGDQVMKFGAFSTMDEKRYISVDDEHAYLIDTDLLEEVDSNQDAYLQTDEWPDYQQVTGVQVSGNTSLDITYAEDADYAYTSAYNFYLKSQEEYQSLEDSKVNSFVSDITDMDMSSYATYTASKEELDQYGLDEPDYTIVLTGDVQKEDTDETEEKTVTLKVGSKKGTSYYARVDESEIVYEVSQEFYDSLSEVSYDTLKPSALCTMDWDKVTELSVTADGKTETVTFKHHKNDTDTYEYEDQEVSFGDAVSALDDVVITDLSGDETKGDTELTIEISQDNEKFPTVTIVLYRYDGENCIAEVNGTTVGLVSRSDMTNLREAMVSALL